MTDQPTTDLVARVAVEADVRRISDDDAAERAWCWMCGAEFCPNGRYLDCDDQAELCEGCERKHGPAGLGA
jgi:hypothetical protein